MCTNVFTVNIYTCTYVFTVNTCTSTDVFTVITTRDQSVIAQIARDLWLLVNLRLGLFATINPWHCDITHDSAVRIENALSAVAENG